MKIRDLIESVEQDDLLNHLEEMISRAKARGFSKVSTPAILAKLEATGYVLEMQNLLDLLGTIASVGSATKELITLNNALPPSPDGDDGGAEKVKKMASKQLMKDK